MRTVPLFAALRTRKIGPGSLFSVLITAGFLLTGPVSAQEFYQSGLCAGDYDAGLSCNSNDIELNSVAQMTIAEGGSPPLTTCTDGDMVTLDIKLTQAQNATSRYDTVVWFGKTGNNPRAVGGSCFASSMPGDPANPAVLDLEAGGDSCLDAAFSATPVEQYFFDVIVECKDVVSPTPDPGDDPDTVLQIPDGKLDLFALISWHNNASGLACGLQAGENLEPGGKPKCDVALLLDIDVDVLEAATIQVVKNSSGGTDNFSFTSDVPGLGNFALDTTGDNTESTAVIDIADTDVGMTFSITEDAIAGWALVDADPTCSNGDPASAVTPLDGQDVVCIFNNAALGTVTVVKNTVGGDDSFDFTTDVPGLGAAGAFSITTSGNTGMEGTTTMSVPAGTYFISETGEAGWDLTSAMCDGNNSDPAVLNIEDGETVVCTFVNTERGTIIVEKQTLPDGSPATFEFSGNVAGIIADGGQISTSNLVPGTYASTEIVPADWVLTSIICDDGASTTPSTVANETATFELDPGETVTCVFNNTQDGSIEVVKSLSATGPAVELFGFTSNFNGAFNLDGDAATTGAIAVTPGSGYTVSEDDPTANGWVNTGASCTGGDDPTSDIVVSPGEAVVCTFTNTPLGSATIIKNTVGGDDTFDFIGDAPFNGVQLTTVGGTASQDFTFELTAGQYDATESPIPAGWALTDLGCVEDGDQDSSVNNPTATYDVELAETVTCTFTNTADGTLIIRKETIPDAVADAFTFEGEAAGDIRDYSDTGEQLSVSGQPDIYSSAEVVPTGWELTNISCTGQVQSVVSIGVGTPAFEPGDTNVNVDLAAGETVICTFENTAQGSITIEKTSVGNTGSFTFNRDFGASFPLDTTGDNFESVTFSNLLPGDFLVSEVVPSGWDLTNIVCSGETNSTFTIGGDGGFDPGDVGVTIGLMDGEALTCAFTNTARAMLTLQKDLPNDNGGTAIPTDFQAYLDGSPVDWGVPTEVLPGVTYTASEDTLPGYDASGGWYTDCAMNGEVTPGPGENLTCTITNDDVAPVLTIIKTVVNDDGGDAVAGDWIMDVTATNPSDTGFAGAEDPGVDITIDANADYSVDESGGPLGYEKTLGAGCTGNLSLGGSATCVITNDDIAPVLTIIKTVVNNSGGTAVAGNWNMDVTATNPSATGFPGVEDPGVDITVDANADYSVDESGGPDGYQKTLGNGCAGNLGPGGSEICVITNDDIPSYLTLVKEVDNSGGGSLQPDNWELFADGPTPISGFGGAEGNVNAGDYALSEVPDGGIGAGGFYVPSAWDCIGGGSLVGSTLTLGLDEEVTCTIVNTFVPDQPVPVNNPLALLLMTLMMLASAWYFRPEQLRKF